MDLKFNFINHLNKKPKQHKTILIFLHFCASIFEQCNLLPLGWDCGEAALHKPLVQPPF